MNKIPVTAPSNPSNLSSEKICPILGVIPISGSNIKSTIGAHPCVRDKCALWDVNHEQCSYLTKSQNIEQLTDVIFKLIKKLDHESK